MCVGGYAYTDRCKSRLYDVTYVKHMIEVHIGPNHPTQVYVKVGRQCSFLNEARPQLSLK